MKKLFLLAGSLIVIGGLMFTMTGCASGWSFNGELVEKTVEITESFSGIDISSDTADITFIPTEDGSGKIVSHDVKKVSYSATVEDGVLKIKMNDSRKWFERIFNGGKRKLDVYLPVAEYTSLTIAESTGDITIPNGYSFGDVKIKLSTGDVNIQGINAADFSLTLSTGDASIYGINCRSFTSTGSTGDISISNINANGGVYVERSTGDINVNAATISGKLETKISTGKADLSNITCAELKSTGSTSDITLSNVIASGGFYIDYSTGDVKFNRCDAAEITVSVSTGDVTGTLLTPKIFQAHANTGKVQVPEYWEGGKCKINTKTGDIKISIEQ